MGGSTSGRVAAPNLEDSGNYTTPQATIAIITQGRKDELRAALRSALEQDGSVEVLVLDDGSRDGTTKMLRQEFPEVRVVRFDDGAGLALRRNDAVRLAGGEIIFSIDDDAVFSSPRIVADTIRDFDHPRIGAVAIPYIDVGISPDVQQRAPEPQDRWVASVFRGTANAVRRDVLIEVGGYSPEIQWVGEEWDVSLRMLDAGYVIRLGRAEPIHHHASPRRNSRRIDVYGRRNELLICWRYFPVPWNLVYMTGYALKGLKAGIRIGRPWNMVVGVTIGVRLCVATRAGRRPISRQAFRLDQRIRSSLRAGRAIRLAEAERELGLPRASPPPPGGRWPGPTERLHIPLRQARTKITETLGRPVRCELCGEILFRGIPFIWRGRLNLLGAESELVRVDWDKMNRLTFRHVEIDRCGSR